jgi:NAD(P)-dependent dehydrogenase (short-subunit alcohol dehydrogenase family)
MLERGSGRIVNVASLVGTLASPYESDYAAAKAAVIRMTDSVGAELYETDVKVWAISPGLVKTAMTMDTLADEGAKEWLSDYFEIGDEDYTPASRAGELVCRLARGDADALTGRFIHVKDDLDRLIESSDDIIERDDHVMRLRPDRQHLARDTDE